MGWLIILGINFQSADCNEIFLTRQFWEIKGRSLATQWLATQVFSKGWERYSQINNLWSDNLTIIMKLLPRLFKLSWEKSIIRNLMSFWKIWVEGKLSPKKVLMPWFNNWIKSFLKVRSKVLQRLRVSLLWHTVDRQQNSQDNAERPFKYCEIEAS